jgi:hypothetical protein
VLLAGSDEPARLLGRDVLAELADGRLLLRRLMPGAEAGRFDLAGYNVPPLPSVVVRSARLVAGVLSPEAWSDRSPS